MLLPIYTAFSSPSRLHAGIWPHGWAPVSGEAALQQQLRDLHGVERGALLDLVAAHEELQPLVAGLRDVAAHAADVHVVVVGGVQRRGEAVGGAVVDDLHARRLGQRLERLLLRHLPGELEIDALRVRAHHGHADAGGCDRNVLVAPDLLRLLGHFHLLFVVAVVHHGRVVAEQVEGVLEGEDLHRDGLVVQHLARLQRQLVHGGLPRAAGGLVRAHDHALDGADLVQRRDGHERDDGGAVGVGDDAALALAPLHARHRLGVHLRDDQRYALRHAVRRAVVHHLSVASVRDPNGR
mmetsp:Transcript_13737/g.34646  ORF Transcript_13737/g.34646 Transcript_13737/m.34646 type:complete len:295 (+) Transcript_13737:148-1032(+)